MWVYVIIGVAGCALAGGVFFLMYRTELHSDYEEAVRASDDLRAFLESLKSMTIHDRRVVIIERLQRILTFCHAEAISTGGVETISGGDSFDGHVAGPREIHAISAAAREGETVGLLSRYASYSDEAVVETEIARLTQLLEETEAMRKDLARRLKIAA